jgi:hypothetical protein
VVFTIKLGKAIHYLSTRGGDPQILSELCHTLLLLLVNETSSCSSFKLTDSYSLHILL